MIHFTIKWMERDCCCRYRYRYRRGGGRAAPTKKATRPNDKHKKNFKDSLTHEKIGYSWLWLSRQYCC